MLSFVFSKRPAIGSLYIRATTVSEEKKRRACGIYARVMTYLPCEHAPIESQVTGNVNELNVRGHLLAHSQVDNVSGDERSSGEACLHTISEDNYVSGEHTLDRSHDTRGREVLPRVEGCLKNDDDEKNDGEGKIGCLWVRVPQRLPKSQVGYEPFEIPLGNRAGEYVIPGQETDNAGSQQQAPKPAKNPADDLAQHTFRRRRDLVSTVLRDAALCLCGIEACLWRDRQPAESLIDGHTVPVEF